jgi:hypothetical protein
MPRHPSTEDKMLSTTDLSIQPLSTWSTVVVLGWCCWPTEREALKSSMTPAMNRQATMARRAPSSRIGTMSYSST